MEGKNRINNSSQNRKEKNYYRLSGVCPRVLEMKDQWRVNIGWTQALGSGEWLPFFLFA